MIPAHIPYSRTLTACTLIALTAVLASVGTAHAGSCPADKIAVSARAPGPSAHQGVTDKVIASVPLQDEAPRLKDHQFRLRRLVIQPGGVVAWHSHAERPAIIYIVTGTIVEYASTCSIPIVHKAGDVARETHATAHWWKNRTNKPVVLLSTDILHMKDDPHTM